MAGSGCESCPEMAAVFSGAVADVPPVDFAVGLLAATGGLVLAIGQQRGYSLGQFSGCAALPAGCGDYPHQPGCG